MVVCSDTICCTLPCINICNSENNVDSHKKAKAFEKKR